MKEVSQYRQYSQHNKVKFTREAIQKLYSEETGKLIDEKVCRLVSDAYQRSKELLQQNKESLQKVAELLLKK